MFLDRVVHFWQNLGEQVKGRPTRKLKSLIEVPYVTRLKVKVQRCNMNLISSPSRLLDRVIHFGENLGDEVNGRSPKKLKSFKELPYVSQVKEHVLSFNRILI